MAINRHRTFLLLLSGLLLTWIAADLLIPRRHSLRDFDPEVVARLDADMWRSYYERRRLKLFGQLSRLMRQQFHAPFWRSLGMAYRAAKAAVVFQEGTNREEYARALPHLEKYYGQIAALSLESFNVQSVARDELEWWIIRRDTSIPPAQWEQLLAGTSAEMYGLPTARFAEYARLRVEAMLLRDRLGQQITEADWERIAAILQQAWRQLHAAAQ